jgi:polyisoprenyl-teichoic acid--peptidoglycan teichoic acid transferase
MARTYDGDEQRPRRSWKRRILIGFNCVLAVLLVAGVAAAGYVKWRFNEISKVNLQSVLGGGNSGSSQPMTVLLVGSDTRALDQSGDQKSFGNSAEVGGQRSDTIMLLHVDPKTEHAAILSLPRDLWVPIAGTNGKNRINSAFDNGPQNLIKTIQSDFGIPINHYAEVDFDSFRSIVNSIGGVEIPFAAPARDWGYDESTGTTHNLSGLNITQTGCVNLNGNQALSYVRSRHYQLKLNGRWVSDPLSDLGRIQRQQDFIRRVMRKSVDKGSSNPLTLNSLISDGVKNLTIDSGFSLSTITSLAHRFQSLDPNKVEMMTLPNTSATIGGADVLLPKQPDAQETINRFLNGDQSTSPASEIPPASISIRVLNGSGVSGQAAETSGGLGNVGFVVLDTGDGARLGTTTIQYASGEKDKADVIARYLSGPVREVQDSALKGVDAIVTTGTSFQGVNSTGTTTSTSTTSTVPQTTTSTTQSPFVPPANESC